MANKPTRTLTIDGQTRYLVDWAREAGICSKIVRSRIDQGWDEARAVFEPQVYSRTHRDRSRIRRQEEPKAPAPPKVPNMLRPCVGGYRAWPISALDVLRRTA